MTDHGTTSVTVCAGSSVAGGLILKGDGMPAYADLLPFDPVVFADLVEDLSVTPADAYLVAFDELLDQRLARITRSAIQNINHSIDHGINGQVAGNTAGGRTEADWDETETALLSLHASATMAGALRLGEVAALALRSLRSHGVPVDRSAMEFLFRRLEDEVILFRSAYRRFRAGAYPAAA